MVILAGTNDIGGNGGPVPLGAVEDNLASMTELARSHGIRVVLGSLLPVSDDKKDAEGRPLLWIRDHPLETVRELTSWIAEYAHGKDHVYLDYFSATVDTRGCFRADLTASTPTPRGTR